jgi:hypothetical protein
LTASLSDSCAMVVIEKVKRTNANKRYDFFISKNSPFEI